MTLCGCEMEFHYTTFILSTTVDDDDDVDGDNEVLLCMCSALKYYDVQKVNIRCKSICDQWNLLANLATKRREELEVTLYT